MKFVDALNSVNKDESNRDVYLDLVPLAKAVDLAHGGLNYIHNDRYENNQMRLKAYWLLNWYCTDQTVGFLVYFLDDELVGTSLQNGRKCDVQFDFVNLAAALKVRDFLLSIMPEPDPVDYPVINPAELEEDVETFHNVYFTGQLLTNQGFYNGRPVTMVDANVDDYISQHVIITFEDGTSETVEVRKVHLPYHLSKALK